MEVLRHSQKKIGTHQSSLSKCLSPDNNIGIAMIDKIVIAFGINKVWLLAGRSEMPKDVVSSYATPKPEVDYKEKYNDYLKLVGAGAGINKNLTTHVARHTYATYLLNRGIPIETVSRCMGHANIRMTQNYARMLGKKVVNDMQVLLK